MKNNYNSNFKIFYLIYLGAAGAFFPYINVYLEKSIGLSGSQIGLLSALSLLIGVSVIPVWGIVGDKTQKYNLLLKVSIITSLVAIYFYSRASVFPAILVCAIALEVARIGGIPMADIIATNYCHKTKGNYGSIRAMGSLGYMLVAIAVGFIAGELGLDGPLFATYAALFALSFLISFSFPKNEINKEKQKPEKGSFKELLTNKKLLFIMLITILTISVVDSGMTYSGNHLISTLHGSESSISWMTFIQVLPEVGFLMIALKVIKKVGFKRFYILAAASMILRYSVYGFVPNQYAFLLVTSLHCLGIACLTVGNFTYIRNSVNPAVFGTAITLLNAVLNIGKAIFGYIFGNIYESQGSFAIYRIGLIFVIIAFIILLRTKQFDELDALEDSI